MENIRISDGWLGKFSRAAGQLMSYPSGFLKAQMPWGFIATNKPKQAIAPDGRPVPLNSDEQAKAFLLGEKIYHSYRAGRFQFLNELDGVSDETPQMKAEYWKFATTEPAFASSLWTKIISVISNEVIIQPSSKSQYDKDMASWVKECLHRTRGGLRNIGQEIFYHGLIRGNVLCEPKWMVKNTPKWQHLFPHGYWTLKDFVAKSPEDYRLEEDGFRNIKGVWSTRTNQWYPLSYFVFWANRPVYGNKAGVSEARSIRRACTLLKLAHTYRGIYLEQFGLPVLKGTYTKDDGQGYALAYQALERARSLGFILMPDGTDVEALTIAQRGQSDYGEAIEDYRKEIFLAITGSYLYAMEGGVSNAAGNSETHRSTLDLSVWYLCKILEEILNEQIIPWLVSLNTYDIEPPLAQIGGVQDSDLKASMEIDSQLFNMGVPLDRDEIYERYKRTPPKDLEQAIVKKESTPAISPSGGLSGSLPAFADVKRYTQAQTTNYTCGSNAVMHALGLFGKAEGLSEATLSMEMGTSPEDGTSASAIIRGMKSHGINAKGKLGMSLNELALLVASDAVIITSIQLKDSPEEAKDANKEGHWVCVKAVDPSGGTVTYYDPSLGEDRTVAAQEFSSDWHDVDSSGKLLSRFGVICESDDGRTEPTTAKMSDQETKPNPKAWVGCFLSGKNSESVLKCSQMIDDSHLSGKGRVTDPHITLFHGCGDSDQETVRSILKDMPPAKYTLGSLFTFNAGDDGSVPLCAKVYSSALEGINTRIKEALPEANQTYPQYSPHVTLAYMAPDMAKKYLSDRAFSQSLTGQSGLLDQACFTDSAKTKTPVAFASPALMLTGSVKVNNEEDEAAFADEGTSQPTDKESVLAESKKKVKTLPTDEVAIAGADGREVARLLKKAKTDGMKEMARIVEPAVARYLSGKSWAVGGLLNMDEMDELSESFSQSITPADLIGRSRVWLRYRRDESDSSEPTKFSDGTPYVAAFADPIEPLKPEAAIDYFKSLAPKLGDDTGRYVDSIRRKSFTMAEATNKTLLDKVKKIIEEHLESGIPRGDIEIADVMEKAGISPKNPQYCFLPGTMVEGDIIAMSRANYDGPAVEIQTNDGRRLAVSVNHPVLTTRGWKVAGEVENGDYLVCYGNRIESFPNQPSTPIFAPPKRWAVYDQNAPACVEDVFEAILGKSGTIFDSKRPVSPVDFHGDAAFMDGKIDRIRPNWVLGISGVPTIKQGRDKIILVQRNINATVATSHSDRLLNTRRKRPFTPCPIQPSHNAFPDLRTSGCPRSLAVIGHSAKLNPDKFKAIAKSPGGDMQLASKLMNTLPGFVSTSSVVEVKRFRWSGHVYDLQTKTGFIVSQGIVTSNCEMVYRTNMMDAFNTAQDEEMARPVMQEAFPVWRYDGIDDERASEEHKEHFGKYYPSTMSFAQVRGERVWNCRCSPRLVHKSEWDTLSAAGNELESSSF